MYGPHQPVIFIKVDRLPPPEKFALGPIASVFPVCKMGINGGPFPFSHFSTC